MRNLSFDPLMVIPIIVLLAFSIIVLKSVIPEESSQQLVFASAGIVVFLALSRIDYRLLGRFSHVFYGLAIFLLAGTFLFGEATRGSVRWIEIGTLTIQPSELIKPMIIIALAQFASSSSLVKTRSLLTFSLLIAIPTVLVAQQPDLGSSLVLVITGAVIALIAGASLKFFLSGATLSVLAFPLLYEVLKPYQKDRLLAFVQPFSDPLGSGYNVIQSVIAVGSGQFFGRGLGHGTQSQLRFLPERQSDFIFASLAEELGFVGSLLVLGSYALLMYRLLAAVGEAEDPLGRYILVGIFAMLLFQVAVNVGMNLGLVPITGITLPLISLGGSSLIATMASLGVAHSVVIRNRKHRTIEIH